MKLTMSVNALVGKPGIGIRTFKILEETSLRGTPTEVFCRKYEGTPLKETIKFITPIAFAKWIAYGIEFFRFYISTKFFLFKWAFDTFQEAFDKRVAKRLSKGDIFHSWDTAVHSFRRAKELGMITIKDCVIQNDEGAAIAYPNIPHFRGLKMNPDLRESLKYIDYYFVPCDFVRESYEAVGVPKENIITIPFGADIRKFTYDRSLKKDDKFRILFVGVIRARKSVDTLMQAVYELEQEGKIKNHELVMAGRVCADIRDKVNEYQGKIKNFKIMGHVEHDNLNELFNQGDVFVYPSLAESSAKVNYEALAAGLPIITTFNTGTVVRDGKE